MPSDTSRAAEASKRTDDRIFPFTVAQVPLVFPVPFALAVGFTLWHLTRDAGGILTLVIPLRLPDLLVRVLAGVVVAVVAAWLYDKVRPAGRPARRLKAIGIAAFALAAWSAVAVVVDGSGAGGDVAVGAALGFGFFLFLGVDRFQQRTGSNPTRMRVVAAVLTLATLLVLLPAVRELGGLPEFGGHTRSSVRWFLAVTQCLAFAGLCLAFFLPYAGQKVDNAWFAYWTARALSVCAVALLVSTIAFVAINAAILAINSATNILGYYFFFFSPSVTTFCFGLLWPVLAMAALPDLTRDMRVPPPAPGRWSRAVVWAIFLPLWIVLAPYSAWFSTVVATKAHDAPSGVFFLSMAVASATVALQVLILREGRSDRLSRIWVRALWPALAPLTVGIWIAIAGFEFRHESSLTESLAVAATIWLSFCVLAGLLRPHDSPRLVFAAAAICALGAVIALNIPAIVGDGRFRSSVSQASPQRDSTQVAQTQFEQRSWVRGTILPEIAPDVWMSPPRTYTDTSSKEAGILRLSPSNGRVAREFEVTETLDTTTAELVFELSEVSAGKPCRIARLDIREMVRNRDDGASLYDAESGGLRIRLLPHRIWFRDVADTGQAYPAYVFRQIVELTYVIQLADAASFDLATCPPAARFLPVDDD